jgi:hypothetical protein
VEALTLEEIFVASLKSRETHDGRIDENPQGSSGALIPVVRDDGLVHLSPFHRSWPVPEFPVSDRSHCRSSLAACLSFGNEFRHKTMELLVSQPVSRLRIWREKRVVVAIAILTTSLVVSICSRTPVHVRRPEDLDYVMFLVITTCSAAFWTLFARSTLGGLMLNIAIVIPLGLAKFSFWEWNAAAGRFSNTGVMLILSAATLGYSAVMLWLGRWMLIRRQSGADLPART